MASLNRLESIESKSSTKKSPTVGINVVPAVDEKAQAFLPAVAEEDADEALKLAGKIRTQFSEEYMDKVRRKIDRRIVPIMAAVYFTQFLDKTSLNYSSVMGLPIDGQFYNLVTLAFYLGFLVWEIPTQYIAQRLPLAKYLGANVVVWSAVLMLHAAAPKFGPFFALRFILGMLESCVSPILILIVSSWYKKNEQGVRISSFYLMNGMTQVIGGLLAFGVTFYEGTALAQWRLIYIILGLISLVVGVLVLLFLPDSPATAHFLTEEERIAAIERVRDNQSGTVNKQWKQEQFKEALTDSRTWLILLSTALFSVPNGGLQSFLSKILVTFGFTGRLSLLLNVPQGVVGAIVTMAVGIWSDRSSERMLPIFGCVVPTIIGAAMLVGFDVDRIKFKAGCIVGILLVSAYGSALSIIYSWAASNIAGTTKKTTVNTLLMVAFAIGNICGGEIFLPKDAPGYLPGKIAVLVIFVLLAILALILRSINICLNCEKAAALRELVEQHGWTDEDLQRERDKAAFLDLTDRQNPYFTYVP